MQATKIISNVLLLILCACAPEYPTPPDENALPDPPKFSDIPPLIMTTDAPESIEVGEMATFAVSSDSEDAYYLWRIVEAPRDSRYAAELGMRTVSRADFLGDAVDLEYRDGLIYVAALEEGLKVFALESNGELNHITTLALPGEYGFLGQADLAALTLHEDRLYLSARRDGVYVVDISVPESPQLIGHYVEEDEDVASQFGGADIMWPYLMVTDIMRGVIALDVSDPENIFRDLWFPQASCGARDIELRGTEAIIRCINASIRHYDFQVLRAPFLLGQYELNRTGLTYGLHFTDEIVIAAEFLAGVGIYSYADPDPELNELYQLPLYAQVMTTEATIGIPDLTRDVELSGDRLFVGAWKDGGLREYDISGEAPVLIDSYRSGDYVTGVEILDGHLVMFGGLRQAGMRVDPYNSGLEVDNPIVEIKSAKITLPTKDEPGYGFLEVVAPAMVAQHQGETFEFQPDVLGRYVIEAQGCDNIRGCKSQTFIWSPE